MIPTQEPRRGYTLLTVDDNLRSVSVSVSGSRSVSVSVSGSRSVSGSGSRSVSVSVSGSVSGSARTEEVQAIIDRMPTQWAKYVSLLTTVLISLIILSGFIIRYPDTVDGQISVTANLAPIRIVISNMSKELSLKQHIISGSAEQLKKDKTLLAILAITEDEYESKLQQHLSKEGGMNVSCINLRQWRELCGVVMQDGKMFSDTILNNIVLDDERINYDRVREAVRIAQIDSEINEMPKGFDTMIGETGRGLSGGQKQRLLIARALYRNPKFLFLDEATNALDTINEQKLVEALKSASVGRTVVIIAHRLSTIRHADQIIVLNRGIIAEVGKHDELLEKKGLYASLVASQMYIQP